MVSCDGHACVLIGLLQTEEHCKVCISCTTMFPKYLIHHFHLGNLKFVLRKFRAKNVTLYLSFVPSPDHVNYVRVVLCLIFG